MLRQIHLSNTSILLTNNTVNETVKVEIDGNNKVVVKNLTTTERIIAVLSATKETLKDYNDEISPFTIIMPDGEKVPVLLNLADSLEDMTEKLDREFGDNCMFVGVKINRKTEEHKNWMLAFIRACKLPLSIVFR